MIIPSLAGIIATSLLLRTIWVANSLDVILVMTSGGPGYATHTLPLYAFLKAYSAMEFGYAAALAIILTFLLLLVVFAYVRRAAGDLSNDRCAARLPRRLLEIELPVLLHRRIRAAALCLDDDDVAEARRRDHPVAAHLLAAGDDLRAL